jgi:hypothetical protein
MRTMCAVTRYVSSSVHHRDGHTPQTPVSKLTDEQLVEHCLAEAGNDPRQAFRLASKHARGARLRAVTARIGSALLRRSVS